MVMWSVFKEHTCSPMWVSVKVTELYEGWWVWFCLRLPSLIMCEDQRRWEKGRERTRQQVYSSDDRHTYTQTHSQTNICTRRKINIHTPKATMLMQIHDMQTHTCTQTNMKIPNHTEVSALTYNTRVNTVVVTLDRCVCVCVHVCSTAWVLLKDRVNNHCAAFSCKIVVFGHINNNNTLHSFVLQTAPKVTVRQNRWLFFHVIRVCWEVFRVMCLVAFILVSASESTTTNLSRSASQ